MPHILHCKLGLMHVMINKLVSALPSSYGCMQEITHTRGAGELQKLIAVEKF